MSDLIYSSFRDTYLSMISKDLAGYKNNYELFSSEELIRKLFKVSDLLIDNAKKFNLTSILDPAEIIRKHLIDSLIPLGLLLDEGFVSGSVLDVGTGAGFPLLPWSCALAEYDVKLTGLDATAKKITHILQTGDAAGLSGLDAMQARAEEAAQTAMRESFSLVTARAVADLPVLIELCGAFVVQDGIFAPLKSHSEAEIEASRTAAKTLGLRLEKVIPYVIPGGDHRSLVIYRKVSPAPKKYPRKFSDISKKPL